MVVTISYLLSQFFIILNYLLLMMTYQQKDRSKILVLNLLAQLVTGLSYICLKAYTGLGMAIFSIIRNIIFYFNNNEKNCNKFKDIFILVILISMLVIITIITYDGILSMMAVLATFLYTYSIWQKNTKIYKILGIPVSVMGILYNIFISSLFGVILESVVLISALVGFRREKKVYG